MTASDSGGSGFNYMHVNVYKNDELLSDKSVTSSSNSTFSFTLDGEGKWVVYAMVYDNASNKQNQSPENEHGWYYQTYIIDKTTPVINYDIADGAAYNTSKTLTITASDSGGSGFNYMHVNAYRNDVLVNEKSVTSSKNNTFTVSLDTEGKWYVLSKVFDNAGNRQNQSPENENGWYYRIYYIDKTAPTVNFNLQEGNYSSLQSLILTPSDNLTYCWFDYAVFKDGNLIAQEWSLDKAKTLSYNDEGTYTISYAINDLAGNKSTGTKTYVIDKGVPTISYVAKYADGSGTYTSGNWTYRQVNTTISATDTTSGISSIQYILKSTYDSNNNTSWNTFSFSVGALTQSGNTWTGTESWSVQNGRNDTYYFRACNNAGKCSDPTSTTFNIKYDISPPTITYSLVGGTYSSPQTISVNVSDNIGIRSIHWQLHGPTYSSGNETGNFQVTIPSDGTWILYTMVTDLAGLYNEHQPLNENGFYYQSYTINSITCSWVKKLQSNGNTSCTSDTVPTNPSAGTTYTSCASYTGTKYRFKLTSKVTCGNNTTTVPTKTSSYDYTSASSAASACRDYVVSSCSGNGGSGNFNQSSMCSTNAQILYSKYTNTYTCS